jgi:hypothetical protein
MLVKYSLDHQDASHYVCIIWIYALEKNRKEVIVYYSTPGEKVVLGNLLIFTINKTILSTFFYCF